MKVKDLPIDSEVEYVTITDLENFFNVHQDEDGNYFYNMNYTMYFNGDKTRLPTFTLTHNMFWPLISYKIYGTTRLAWLLMKINNVHVSDAMRIRRAGEQIKYLPSDKVQGIVSEMNGYY